MNLWMGICALLTFPMMIIGGFVVLMLCAEYSSREQSKTRRTRLICAAAGLLASVIAYVVASFLRNRAAEYLLALFFLFYLLVHGSTPFTWAFSILANIGLYEVLGLTVVWLYKRVTPS